MNNKNILNKISQGMYILTTNNGGCVVDAVSQISGGDNPLIAVSVMKKNYTNELLKKSDKFVISILSKEVDPEIIKIFGFNSMREINKFASVETFDIDGINAIKNSIGYILCEKVDSIDNDTHTLFIGKMIKCDMFSDLEPMTYLYYQEHKDELLKVVTNEGKVAWICTTCGFIYYGEELPNDYTCPICGVSKEYFEKK